MRNFLSLSDNASCKLAFIDAAEFGNSAEPKGSMENLKSILANLDF